LRGEHVQVGGDMAGMTASVTDCADAEGTLLLANNFDGIFSMDQNVSVFEISIRVLGWG